MITRDQMFSAALILLALPYGVMAADWVELFNGKDLSGWEQKNGTATYEVKDGVIVGMTAKGSPNSFLCTTKEYGDFELEFEVKVDPRLNSGVQIRSKSYEKYKNYRVHGPQVEIATNGSAGYIYGEAAGGWLSQDRPKHRHFNNDGWNKYTVRAVGGTISTTLNGQPITTLKENQKVQKDFAQGFIGLQVHSFRGKPPAEVMWRNIRIREIPTTKSHTK